MQLPFLFARAGARKELRNLQTFQKCNLCPNSVL